MSWLADCRTNTNSVTWPSEGSMIPPSRHLLSQFPQAPAGCRVKRSAISIARCRSADSSIGHWHQRKSCRHPNISPF